MSEVPHVEIVAWNIQMPLLRGKKKSLGLLILNKVKKIIQEIIHLSFVGWFWVGFFFHER